MRFLTKDRFATLGLDHVIGIVDPEKGQAIQLLQCNPGPVAIDALSSNPDVLLVGTEHGTIRIYDIRTGGSLSPPSYCPKTIRGYSATTSFFFPKWWQVPSRIRPCPLPPQGGLCVLMPNVVSCARTTRGGGITSRDE